jgi:hypothetical protein
MIHPVVVMFKQNVVVIQYVITNMLRKQQKQLDKYIAADLTVHVIRNVPVMEKIVLVRLMLRLVETAHLIALVMEIVHVTMETAHVKHKLQHAVIVIIVLVMGNVPVMEEIVAARLMHLNVLVILFVVVKITVLVTMETVLAK